MSRTAEFIFRRVHCVSRGRSIPQLGLVVLRRESVWVPQVSRWLWNTRDVLATRNSTKRSYHATPMLLKGKGPSKRSEQAPKRSVQIANQRSEAAGDDPFDFTDLQKAIADGQERLRTALQKISPSGQVTQESVEAVRVKLSGGESVDLSDLGQVVPKGGRKIAVIVGQLEHVKHVASAVLNQLQVNAPPAAEDPLELQIPVPPPTQESRKNAQKQVVEAGERALGALRQARTSQQKRHRAMEISKRVKEDDLHKASKDMEKVMEKATAEAKKTIDAAKKAMDR